LILSKLGQNVKERVPLGIRKYTLNYILRLIFVQYKFNSSSIQMD